MKTGMLTETMDPTEVRLTRQEFKDRSGIDATQRHMHRLCKKLGLRFKDEKPGPKPGPRVI
jgi:hypothetical protein